MAKAMSGRVTVRYCNAGHAAVEASISDRLAVSRRGLGPCIGWCGDGLAVRHSSSLEEIINVVGLGEVEAVRGAPDIDAQEILEVAHVLDGEG
jgi:hypothetical protein